MTLIANLSAKGAPGVTVTSLALTLAWPRSAILAECDPSGGSVLAGYLAGQLPADRGVARLAVAERHGRLFDEFGLQLIDLGADRRAGHQRLLLPGITDPAQAASLAPLWDRLGGYLAQLAGDEPPHVPYDVIADCGRIPAPHAPLPLIHRADVVLLMVGRTLDSISAAVPRVTLLRRELHEHGIGVLRLLVRGTGDYSAPEIAKHLDVPVLAELPEDERTARMLSTGRGTPRGNAELLRAARSAQEPLNQLIQHRRAASAAPVPRREAVHA